MFEGKVGIDKIKFYEKERLRIRKEEDEKKRIKERDTLEYNQYLDEKALGSKLESRKNEIKPDLERIAKIRITITKDIR